MTYTKSGIKCLMLILMGVILCYFKYYYILNICIQLSSMILHWCANEYVKASKRKQKKKTFQKKLAQQTDCSRISSSTPPHLLRSVYNNLLSALQVYSGYLLQTHLPQIHTTVCYVLPVALFLLLSAHRQSPTPSPSQPLMIHLLSINQFLKLCNYHTPQGVRGNL